MELTQGQYELIAPHLPVQRGNVKIPNLKVLNAILYVAEHGCKWRRTARALRQMAHCLYENEPLVQEWGSRPCVRAASEGRNSGGQSRRALAGQHHCQGASGRDWRVEKNGPQSIGRSRGGLTTKIHMVAADERTPVIFSLSAGQAHDAPEGRKLLERLGPQRGSPSVVMDRAYEGDATRQLASGLGYSVVVPPRKSRKVAWEYDEELYKRRNEVERLVP